MTIRRTLILVELTLILPTILALSLSQKSNHDCEKTMETWYSSQNLDRVSDGHLKRHENQDAFGDAPFFRLTTSSDLTIVEPKSTHTVQLIPTSSFKNISNFMIWTETKDECPSTLRALSESRSNSLGKCQQILVSQPDEQSDVLTDVSFEWQAGDCGYHSIYAMVMDMTQHVYSPKSDPFEALQINCYVD